MFHMLDNRVGFHSHGTKKALVPAYEYFVYITESRFRSIFFQCIQCPEIVLSGGLPDAGLHTYVREKIDKGNIVLVSLPFRQHCLDLVIIPTQIFFFLGGEASFSSHRSDIERVNSFPPNSIYMFPLISPFPNWRRWLFIQSRSRVPRIFNESIFRNKNNSIYRVSNKNIPTGHKFVLRSSDCEMRVIVLSCMRLKTGKKQVLEVFRYLLSCWLALRKKTLISQSKNGIKGCLDLIARIISYRNGFAPRHAVIRE